MLETIIMHKNYSCDKNSVVFDCVLIAYVRIFFFKIGADKSSSSNGMPDTSVYSTPGGTPLPPNPPPTPHIGVGGIPIPPPPPPTLPGGHGQTNKLKRVNWEKVQGTEGTIWSEVRL